MEWASGVLLQTSIYASDYWNFLFLWGTRPSSSSGQGARWYVPSYGDMLAMWLWSNQNRGRAQTLCWTGQVCVSVELELSGHQAWSTALLQGKVGGWRATHGAERETGKHSPGNIFRALQNWGRNGHIPRLFSYLSYHVLFVYSVRFGSFCNQGNHESHGKISLFPCAWVMGTGSDMHKMRYAFATATALTILGLLRGLTNCGWVGLNEHRILRVNITDPFPVPITVGSLNQWKANCVFSLHQQFHK